MTALFRYPDQAAFNRPVSKRKIYRYAKPSGVVRDRFVSGVQQITWAYKLAPETVNLPAAGSVAEIQVFVVDLKHAPLGREVLETIDHAIHFPIFFELRLQGRVKSVAAYKRPSNAAHGRQVIEAYFETDWLPEDAPRAPLPVVLDLAGLYERMLRAHLPLLPRPGENLKALATRLERIRGKEVEIRRVQARLRREVQFNRKVEINATLRRLRHEFDALSR